MRHVARLRLQAGSEKMDLTVASFDDPSRSRPSIISASRACTAPGSTPRACPSIAPTSISRWSTAGWRRRWQAPRLGTAFDPPRRRPRLAWHELGRRGQVVLLHGLFSDADTNWIRFGQRRGDRRPRLSRDHADLRGARDQRQAARSGALSPRHPRRRRLAIDRASRPHRLRPRRLFARRTHRGPDGR